MPCAHWQTCAARGVRESSGGAIHDVVVCRLERQKLFNKLMPWLGFGEVEGACTMHLQHKDYGIGFQRASATFCPADTGPMQLDLFLRQDGAVACESTERDGVRS
jgi:hypothetical protein